jgi:hypothetical protein
MKFWGVLLLAACAQGAEHLDDAGFPDAHADTSAEQPDAPEEPPDSGVPCAGGTTAMEFHGSCYLHFSAAAPDWNTAQSTCAAQVD